MRRTPVFGDPKTGFVFQRIFGSDDHKTALIGFLNDVLGLDEAHRVTSVALLPPEQRPRVSELERWHERAILAASVAEVIDDAR